MNVVILARSKPAEETSVRPRPLADIRGGAANTAERPLPMGGTPQRCALVSLLSILPQGVICTGSGP